MPQNLIWNFEHETTIIKDRQRYVVPISVFKLIKKNDFDIGDTLTLRYMFIRNMIFSVALQTT